MNNSNRGQSNRGYQGRNSSFSSSSQYRPTSSGRESSQRSDWYERDPMDEKSGYRAESSRPMNPNYGYESSSRPSMGDDSGYDPSSRRASRSGRDEHQFDTFGSRSSSSSDFYRPSDSEDYENEYSRSGGSDYDRAYNQQSRGMRSNYDSQRYTQGQGAYGTSSSGQTGSYGSGGYYGSDRPSSYGSNSSFGGGSSYGQDFGRNYEGSSSLGQDRNRSWQSSDQGQGYNQGSNQNESRSQYSGRGPKSFKRSDERIKEEVCEMLTRHNAINADDIEVEVKEGEVTLTGTVNERRMKHLAEDVVEQCYGVKDVTNNIRVKRSEETDSSSDRKGGSSTSSTTGKKSATGSTSTNPLPNH